MIHQEAGRFNVLRDRCVVTAREFGREQGQRV